MGAFASKEVSFRWIDSPRSLPHFELQYFRIHVDSRIKFLVLGEENEKVFDDEKSLQDEKPFGNEKAFDHDEAMHDEMALDSDKAFDCNEAMDNGKVTEDEKCKTTNCTTNHTSESPEEINLVGAKVPSGNWNIGHLLYNSQTKTFTVASTETKTLPSIEVWHPRKIDYSTLGKKFLPIRPQAKGKHTVEGYYSHFGTKKVLVIYEWSPESVHPVGINTKIYAMIDGHDIAPKFLAHVTENKERVIGYMIEELPCRRASIDDLDVCRKALTKLHGLGIAKGGLWDVGFLITEDGKALLDGFEEAYQTSEESVFEAEMKLLEVELGGRPSAKPMPILFGDEVKKDSYAAAERGSNTAVKAHVSTKEQLRLAEEELRAIRSRSDPRYGNRDLEDIKEQEVESLKEEEKKMMRRLQVKEVRRMERMFRRRFGWGEEENGEEEDEEEEMSDMEYIMGRGPLKLRDPLGHTKAARTRHLHYCW